MTVRPHLKERVILAVERHYECIIQISTWHTFGTFNVLPVCNLLIDIGTIGQMIGIAAISVTVQFRIEDIDLSVVDHDSSMKVKSTHIKGI